MADVQPLRALHYDLGRVGPLQALASPPYDVIDAAGRAELAARSPHNAVHLDLPEAPAGEDHYAVAARLLASWRRDGVLTRDPEPALWALRQDYTGPDGRALSRRGVLCRVRVEDYGAGRIRPHERTHPGPREDRLRLTRATRMNLSPIFSLFDDPRGAVQRALEPQTTTDPWGSVRDEDDTLHTVWRVADPGAVAAVGEALVGVELLIADGHHRYETARVYAHEQEVLGTPGDGHRFVLMCLIALQDPGLTVFPTHRLLQGLDDRRRAALRDAITRDFTVEEVDAAALEPTGEGPVRFGYLDAFHRRPLMLTLRDPSVAAAALPGKPAAYRALDTAVLEAILLRGALGMTEDDISHLRGLDYARSTAQARAQVEGGERQVAFFMRATPVTQVRDVAAAAETMPPKSTYFFPKLLTGLLFNPLQED